MKSIRVKDKSFSISIEAKEIDKSVENIAKKINKDFADKNPLFLIILNGAFVFGADLLKKINIDCEVSFVKLASYSGTKTTAKVSQLIGLNEDIKNRIIIIVEDIIDTGITMDFLLKDLAIKEVAEVKIAVLLFKPKAFVKDFKIDYIGMKIPNDFIVGYGLDYDGLGRNYTDIYKIIE